MDEGIIVKVLDVGVASILVVVVLDIAVLIRAMMRVGVEAFQNNHQSNRIKEVVVVGLEAGVKHVVEENKAVCRRAKVTLAVVMGKVVRNVIYQKVPERLLKSTKILQSESSSALLVTLAHIYL